LKKVRVEDGVGLVLAHDITEIIPGKKKDAAFRRGHVVQKDDVERLLDLGKGYIYVTEGEEDEVHEDEAARRIALSTMDENMELVPAKEGRVNITSKVRGLVTVDVHRLNRLNRIENVVFTTVPDHYPVNPGDLIAATRIIPLLIQEDLLRRAEFVGREGVIKLLPYAQMKAGLVITGTEVATGRITDASSRVEEKLKGYGLELVGKRLVIDEVIKIRDAVMELFEEGADLIITTGGLSVDPDDVTREGVEATGARTISYGAPVFPGAMFLIARLEGRYILGAPACVYYNTVTVLDLVLPWIMAGETVSASRVRKLALGGLCLHCAECHYPRCFLGKGR
jgi:molybdopterin biosynthesis enzyme